MKHLEPVMITLAFGTSALLAACSDTAGAKADAGGATDGGVVDGGAAFESGTRVDVQVPANGRTYLRLAPPAVVTPTGDPKASKEWDLAFEGYDVFTNSGPSGAGAGAAFGPLDPGDFPGGTLPDVPFVNPDKSGGAFLDWYDYDGAGNHVLWSRFHVYGVKDGTRTFKVQVLGYYGERDGTGVPALYTIRYAEVDASGSKPAVVVTDLDGTAGGPAGGVNAKSACIDFGTGERTMLTPAEASGSSAWHVCFRRNAILVNGELGGPRGTGAADLDASETAGETLEAVKLRTPESELARFDRVDAARFAASTFRGDRVVTAFDGLWTTKGTPPLTPVPATWLVVAADGKTRHKVAFAAFAGATTTSPGTIDLRTKPVTP
ncbi:MAG: HmuY family protein [Polyangiaceae bacterium]